MESKTGYRIQRELTREENFNIVHSNQISVISLKNNVIKNNQCICLFACIYIYINDLLSVQNMDTLQFG